MIKFQFVWMVVVASLPVLALGQDSTAAEKSSVESKPASIASNTGVSTDFKSFKEAYAAGNQSLKDYKFDEAAADYDAAENLASSDKGKSQAANAQGWAYWKAKKLEE